MREYVVERGRVAKIFLCQSIFGCFLILFSIFFFFFIFLLFFKGWVDPELPFNPGKAKIVTKEIIDTPGSLRDEAFGLRLYILLFFSFDYIILYYYLCISYYYSLFNYSCFFGGGCFCFICFVAFLLCFCFCSFIFFAF